MHFKLERFKILVKLETAVTVNCLIICSHPCNHHYYAMLSYVTT